MNKSDWKLFREKIEIWQETYMEQLLDEYLLIINSDKDASGKFWALEERIKNDKKKPGVMLQLDKSNAEFDIVRLIRDRVISYDDLDEFSDELKEMVLNLAGR